LFFPVFGFHSTSFFIFRGAKNPPLRPAGEWLPFFHFASRGAF
jgi:hypothetical protein